MNDSNLCEIVVKVNKIIPKWVTLYNDENFFYNLAQKFNLQLQADLERRLSSLSFRTKDSVALTCKQTEYMCSGK